MGLAELDRDQVVDVVVPPRGDPAQVGELGAVRQQLQDTAKTFVNRVDGMHTPAVEELEHEAPVRLTMQFQGPRLALGVGRGLSSDKGQAHER